MPRRTAFCGVPTGRTRMCLSCLMTAIWWIWCRSMRRIPACGRSFSSITRRACSASDNNITRSRTRGNARMFATTTRRSMMLGLAMAAGLTLSGPVSAQADYPTRPVKIIVPFGAGGVADVTIRIVAEKLSEKLGQRFIVENMPGAGGITAARAALSGAPDGQTLAMLTNGTAVSVPLFANLPFDPLTDFAPISTLGTFDFLFVVNAKSEHKSFKDLIQAAKEKPGSLNVATIT